MGAGTDTVRQPAGAAPPEGAALVVELVVGLAWELADVLLRGLELALVLLLPLLPQPAVISTIVTARHALRTEL